MQVFPLFNPRRVLFDEVSPADTVPYLSLAGGRGEMVTGVVAIRLESAARGALGILADISGMSAFDSVRISFAAPVPVRYPTPDAVGADGTVDPTQRELDYPCCLPDPLLPLAFAEHLSANATYSLWVNARISRDCRAGDYSGSLNIQVGKSRHTITIALRVWDFDLPQEPTLSSVNWLYANQLARHHGLRHLSEAWWSAVEDVARNMGEHLHDGVYTPALTPPASPGQLEQTQLVRISADADGRFRFDFRQLDRWVDLFRRHGVTKLHLSHMASPWGALQSNGIWIDGEYYPPEPVDSHRYQDLVRQWLPALQSWVDNRKLGGRIYQYVSDEPTMSSFDHYSRLLEWMRTLAPRLIWADTISDLPFARLLDVPIPRIDVLVRAKMEVGNGPLWTFYSYQPVGAFTNRFIDTPLPVLRMGYWQCFTHHITGLLHWGYNYWHDPYSGARSDPFSQTHTGNFPAGDGFIVYPRTEGQYLPDDPLIHDSVRHEMMRIGLQDHALLTLLASQAGTSPAVDLLLERLSGQLAGSLRLYERDGAELERFRRQVGDTLGGVASGAAG
ncbi:MAG: DUF4091 domain-containing protein [Capsulimonadaceae bacterium]|nr:DUF4091 domain-containing protein [Capsulimonadaceae bacterium]